jgi:hypothetical protein
MKPQLLIVILLAMLQNCTAAPAGTPVPLLDFKPGMVSKQLYKGKIVDGRRWRDSRGENIVILTQSGVYWKDVYDATRSAKLYAYHFIKSTDSTLKEVWKLNDMVYDCAFEVRCEFFNKSLTITDLDSDGTAEVAFVYVLGCKEGFYPEEKKLVFYEGKDHYSIKGTTTVFKGKEKLGGDKAVEKKFGEAPDAFLEYANKQWDKYGTAKLDK